MPLRLGDTRGKKVKYYEKGFEVENEMKKKMKKKVGRLRII